MRCKEARHIRAGRDDSAWIKREQVPVVVPFYTLQVAGASDSWKLINIMKVGTQVLIVLNSPAVSLE